LGECEPATLTLYERADCHLCEEMRIELAAWSASTGVAVTCVDVDATPGLAGRYGDRVPVLVDGEREICHYFLDVEMLAEHLEGRTGGAPIDEGELAEASRYERIYAIARRVPPGRVATYGQIAAIEGNATARQVGYAMAAVRAQHRVPWQRVINARGEISERSGGGGTSRQRLLLQSEGVSFNRHGRVDFERCGWQGPPIDWLERHRFQPAPAPRHA